MDPAVGLNFGLEALSSITNGPLRRGIPLRVRVDVGWRRRIMGVTSGRWIRRFGYSGRGWTAPITDFFEVGHDVCRSLNPLALIVNLMSCCVVKCRQIRIVRHVP